MGGHDHPMLEHVLTVDSMPPVATAVDIPRATLSDL
jgi:hypothetical protein